MTKSGFDIEELERLLAAATPGEWRVGNGGYSHGAEFEIETIDGDFYVAAVPWGDDALEPNIYPHDRAQTNAALIVALHNSAPAMLTEIRELRAENARLREANGILEGGLQEVGDDYPGSSCQEWCQHQIKQARAALGEPQ